VTEPTLGDVLAEMRGLRGEVHDLRGEVKDLRGEVQTIGLESRAGLAEVRLSVARVGTDVQTLIDSLADFRREYAAHPHDRDE
jgi:ribosomal protein L29